MLRTMLRNAGLLAGAVIAVAATVASCTLLIETRSAQCKTNADCASFSHAACDTKQGICVDVSCSAGDCVCDPQTPTDILNACPKGDCQPFDNGAVHASFDGGPPEPPDDAGTAPPPTWSCGTDGGTDGGGPAMLPACEAEPSPLYILGPDSIKPLLGWVAKLFANETPKTTVVFQANSSCTAVKAAYDTSQSLTSVTAPTEMPAVKSWYYDAAGQEHLCSVQTAGIRPNIGLSDVFAQTCGYNTSGSDQSVTDTAGPVQAMGFIVPKAGSDAHAISAEAAYMIYGFGPEAAGIAPWTDTAYVFQRSKSSGTQNLIATALGLDPAKFHGSSNNGSDDEAALVACSPKPEATLGILAVDYVQAGNYGIRLLAYQHYKQSCAYFPDTTEKDNDKRNVRDGHYFIWGPIHMMAPKDTPSAKATELINYVSGIVPPPVADADIFEIWASAHLVPQCAMRVTRATDGGPLASYQPQTSCYCKYDEVTRGTSDCPKCKSATDCPAERPTCSLYGYCEPE